MRTNGPHRLFLSIIFDDVNLQKEDIFMPFSSKTLSFLAENRERNSKEWFHSHKSELKTYVEEPFRELIEAVLDSLGELDPYIFCDPRIGFGISRLYRDTRFSYDKTLFRSSMWCTFMRSKTLCMGQPGFYFEIRQNGFGYGCGYWQEEKPVLRSIRKSIVENSDEWLAAADAMENQTLFVPDGASYKRSLFPEVPERNRKWADLKGYSFSAFSDDFDLLFSDSLADKISADFKLLYPLYLFLLKAGTEAYDTENPDLFG